MSTQASNGAQAPIEVELRPARFPTFAAVVTLRGEHDMATAPSIASSLDAIFGDVLVDLSDCEFCDSSVVRVLLDAGRVRSREGQRLELLVPATNIPTARILEITGVGSCMTIHADLDWITTDIPTEAERSVPN